MIVRLMYFLCLFVLQGNSRGKRAGADANVAQLARLSLEQSMPPKAFEGKAAYHEQIAVRQREDAARLRQQMGASGGEKNVEWRIDDGKTPGTHGRLSCDSRRITPAHPIPLVSPGFVAAAVFPRRLCLHILHDIEVGVGVAPDFRRHRTR